MIVAQKLKSLIIFMPGTQDNFLIFALIEVVTIVTTLYVIYFIRRRKKIQKDHKAGDEFEILE